MSRINIGKVAPIPKGDWVQSQPYEKLNMVSKSGVLYIAKQDVPVNTAITNIDYWMPANGQLSIGTVETVSASTGASATITDGSNGPELNLSIPRGVTSIDDTKGKGDTDYVWSADKSYEEITNKAPVIISSASGSIASFPDGSPAPVDDLTVSIEPVQDLSNGDPSPDNICPITGRTGVNIYRQAQYDANGTPTLSLSWETEAGTVYGGTLDVTTGVLTVDRAKVNLIDLDWTLNGNTTHAFNSSISGRRVSQWSVINNGKNMSNVYKLYSSSALASYSSGFAYSLNNTGIYVKDDRATTVLEAQALFQADGSYIIYELATPLTIQLTPAELTTFLGTNNIWADTGDVAVEYKADTKTYIEAQQAEAESHSDDADTATREMITDSIESAMTATKNYTAGSLIIANNKLLRATANIANGGTITIGSNAEEVDLETVIAEKAESADVYTKAQTDTQIDTTADSVRNLIRLLHPTTDFAMAKTLVDAGHISDFFSVGEQISGTYVDNYLATPVTYDNPWDVVDFKNVTDENNNSLPAMILQMHWATRYAIPFDAPEALFYTETGLPAGTYHFNVTTAWSKLVVGTYQFTLTQAVPADGQIVGVYRWPDVELSTWTVSTYASNTSTTVIETVAVTSGSDGTDLGVVLPYKRVTTAKTVTIGGTDYTYEVNGYQQAAYGYNRWRDSAYRQYLNSDASSNWWTPQHEFDRSPSGVGYPGVLHEMPSAMLSAITPVKILSTINTQDATAEGTDFDTTIDRIWLPCLEEMYISPLLAGESDYWDYYKDLNGTDTMYARGSTYAKLKKYGIENHSTAQSVRLRSALCGYSYLAYFIYSSGNVSSHNAYFASRSVPACAIAKSIIPGA